MRYIYIILILFVFSGCSNKEYIVSEPKIVTFKTQKIKFSDTAYLRYDDNSLELELFSAGIVVEKISIGDRVCISAGCMNRQKFINEYISSKYPPDTIYNILTAKDIFGGVDKSEKCDGTLFQHIRDDDIDILYRRAKNQTYFKDSKNNIIIKIEDIDR